MRTLDFSSILFQDKLVLMVPWPKEESRLTSVIRPYDFIVIIVIVLFFLFVFYTFKIYLEYFYYIQTWSMIFISSLAFVGFIAILLVINRYRIRDEVNSNHYSSYYFLNVFGKGAMYVFAIFTQHGSYKR